MKRGQATLFIILGIVVVSLVAVGYSFREQISTKASKMGLVKTSALPPQFEEKQAEVDSCIQELLELAISIAADQGGYAGVAPQGSLMIGELPVAYYFDKGEDKAPTKETVAEQIEDLIKDEIPKCAQTIGAAEPSKATVKVTIDDTKVDAQVKMPLQVTINGITGTISTFQATTKLRLGTLMSVTGKIISQQASDPENLCLTCINDIATENNMKVELQPYGDGTLAIMTDDSSGIGEDPLRLIFAMRY